MVAVRKPGVVDGRAGIVRRPGNRVGQRDLGIHVVAGIAQSGSGANMASSGGWDAVLHSLPAAQRVFRITQALSGACAFESEWQVVREAVPCGVEQHQSFGDEIPSGMPVVTSTPYP